MIRVAVVDDQALVRGGLRAIIESSPNIEVVGEAEDGAAAIELVRDTTPDVVLMDIRMPVLDGLAATEVISQLGVDTRVLVLTTFDVDEYVYRALRAGASGFLLKDTRPTNLIQAIEIIAAGEALLAPSAMRHLIEAFARRPDDQTPPPAISARSPSVSSTCSGPSPKAGRTWRSPHRSTSVQPPSRRTSAGC